MSGLRYLAPSGTPIGGADLLRWVATMLANRDADDELRRELQRRFAVPHATLMRTGRAGMSFLLRVLRTVAEGNRTEVLVPAYTCYSVAASALKAGLTPRIVDIDAETLDYAPGVLDQIDTSRVLAIVATNLYGLPCDMPRLSAWARLRGVFLIDDAAQAMGASVGGQASGTWGDAGLFSFDRGKNVSATNGGVLITRSATIGERLQAEARSLPGASLGTAVGDAIGAVAYSLLLRPTLYGIPARLPFLGLGRTAFTMDFPLERPSRPLTALALTMLPALEALTRQRRDVAAQLGAAVRGLEGLQIPRVHPHAEPACLRFPVLMPDSASRDQAVARLTARGIGASASYPQALVDVPELRALLPAQAPAPGGRSVAARILTLPTHAYVTAADVRDIADTLAGVLTSHRQTSGVALAEPVR